MIFNHNLKDITNYTEHNIINLIILFCILARLAIIICTIAARNLNVYCFSGLARANLTALSQKHVDNIVSKY